MHQPPQGQAEAPSPPAARPCSPLRAPPAPAGRGDGPQSPTLHPPALAHIILNPNLHPDPRLTSNPRPTSDTSRACTKPESSGSRLLEALQVKGQQGRVARLSAPGATFTAISLLINTPPPRESPEAPQQLVGALACAGSPGSHLWGKTEGGKLGHGSGGSVEGREHPQGDLECGCPVPTDHTVTAPGCWSARAQTTPPGRQAGTSQWGATAWPLPAALGPQDLPGSHSPGAHKASPGAPGATEQGQFGHGEVMGSPGQLLWFGPKQGCCCSGKKKA